MISYEIFDRLCKKNGITAYQVAKKTGVSTSTLSSWKNGRYTPKADKLKMIADYFGVSTDMFYVDESGKEHVVHVKKYINPQDSYRLNDDERKLISNYRKLDKHGKDIVNTILQKEIDRLSISFTAPIAAHERKWVNATDEEKKQDLDIIFHEGF